MPLDVDPPEPPALDHGVDAASYEDADVAGSDEYRRAELEGLLADGAWNESWRRWAASTVLDDEEYAIVSDLGLIAEFDFFWDDFAGRVGYHAPGLPEDWRERNIHPALETWSTVSAINASLTELGQVVSDVLQEGYIDWEASFDAPDDLPDFE